ncbi:integrase [Microbacterium sp. BE35]|uniref:tyrosine-type recombinase/integrase n=1 Tax=Microbacterium sp. BE35 TaxID=2817773 RepID=UPI002863A56F|nr:site-specific integrase [Microbacterium sp. BE35]MDR7189801.1 integrase [Microbacterium sp. BE35]
MQFRIGDKVVQETFPTERGAAEFARLVETAGGAAARQVLRRREEGQSDAVTLRAWTARYLDPESGLLTGVEPGTRKGYERAANNSFLRILGDYPVDAIHKADVGRWLAWQEAQPARRGGGRPVAAKTIRNYHGILSAVLASAVAEKIRDDNPAYKTRLSKGVKREAVFLSPDEFATLLYYIPDHYQGLVMFLAGTGARWGEATAVKWSDVNSRAIPATVRIDEAWKKSETNVPVLKHTKSSKSLRTISLPPDVLDAMGVRGGSPELVFSTRQLRRRVRYQTFRDRVWLPAVEKAMDGDLCDTAGLVPLTRRPTPHDLRHSHASWLIAAGTPLPYVQARLGHESIQTTVNVYGHLVPEAHIQMADVIGGTLANVRTLKQLDH